MTCKNVFDAAVELICEQATGGAIADYTERAPYIFGTFVLRYAGLDAAYRKAHGIEDEAELPALPYLALTEDFPLSPPFAPAAVFYAASMLCADEAEELSGRIAVLAAETISEIASDLPAKCEKIVDKYHL